MLTIKSASYFKSSIFMAAQRTPRLPFRAANADLALGLQSCPGTAAAAVSPSLGKGQGRRDPAQQRGPALRAAAAPCSAPQSNPLHQPPLQHKTVGTKGLLFNPKYRQLKDHCEITTPTPDLRGSVSPPKALASIPRPRGIVPSFLRQSPVPIFQPKRPRNLPSLSRKDPGRNFHRRRPTSPQPGRRAANSPPPPETSPQLAAGRSRVLRGRG